MTRTPEQDRKRAALLKAYRNKDSWKETKLLRWRLDYGEQKEAWDAIFPPVADDRRVFINTYNQILEALKSLPEMPHVWIRVAVAEKLNEECELMDSIRSRFTEKKDGDT